MEEKENSHVRKIGQKSCAGSEKRSSAFNTFFLFLLMGICINDVYFLFCWMREGKGCVFGRGEKTWMEFQLENILEYVCEKIYYAFFYDGIFSFFFDMLTTILYVYILYEFGRDNGNGEVGYKSNIFDSKYSQFNSNGFSQSAQLIIHLIC
jgi:hypothetical protein